MGPSWPSAGPLRGGRVVTPAWQHRGERLLSGPGRWLAFPAWLLWRPLVELRNSAYDHGWLPRRGLPTPVISVGNLTLGGTGKTPVVAAVCAMLRAHGRHPAVLSRGYAGQGGRNDEAEDSADVVFCNPDRHRAGTQALATGANCLVLDDGFQHRRLHRDLDLVCIDAGAPFGERLTDDPRHGAVFPLGRLREPVRALKRATACIITRCDQVAPERLRRLKAQLRHYQTPLFHCSHQAVALSDLVTCAVRESPESLAHRPVVLACGLGNPAAFVASARALGWQVLAIHRFPDHHRYRPQELRLLEAQARRLDATLVVTSKDAAKLRHFSPDPSTRVLHVEACFPADDQRQLTALLTQCCDRPGMI